MLRADYRYLPTIQIIHNKNWYTDIKLLMLSLVPINGVAMIFNPEKFTFWKKLVH